VPPDEAASAYSGYHLGQVKQHPSTTRISRPSLERRPVLPGRWHRTESLTGTRTATCASSPLRWTRSLRASCCAGLDCPKAMPWRTRPFPDLASPAHTTSASVSMAPTSVRRRTSRGSDGWRCWASSAQMPPSLRLRVHPTPAPFWVGVFGLCSMGTRIGYRGNLRCFDSTGMAGLQWARGYVKEGGLGKDPLVLGSLAHPGQCCGQTCRTRQAGPPRVLGGRSAEPFPIAMRVRPGSMGGLAPLASQIKATAPGTGLATDQWG
jgi:hypothetical protein